ncbi:hypothetical protein [Paracidovorax konjaci]|uniref:Uncharacterized protein n=1 Tax=Paracidovorax konjaci TaxID=32040 RepID=A0A1I1WDY2_9BURK|nr:hypothetical protein [Paracidovorax konjaci]SFD93282.1 hypothetical protein SAMN04489710_10969 [Paracidovorax konjaci]
MPSSSEPHSPTLERALAASAAGAAQEAIALFQQAAQEQPGSAAPHFLLGAEFASLGQMDKAEQSFCDAVILAPEWPIPRYQLGLLQFSAGRVSAALLTWQPLLGLDEGNPLPHWVRGFSFLAVDDFSQARAFFSAGLERNTEHPPMSADIRLVLARMDALGQSIATPPAHERVGAEDDADATHVLLSNYQQQGPAH